MSSKNKKVNSISFIGTNEQPIPETEPEDVIMPAKSKKLGRGRPAKKGKSVDAIVVDPESNEDEV